MTDNANIKIEHLSVYFERWGQSIPALKDVSLSILQHQWVMIVGNNGSGKSTLLKVLAGIIEPSAGEANIFIKRNSTEEREQFASGLFYISQDPLAGTAEELTLLENLQVADPNHRSSFSRSTQRNQLYMSLMNDFDLEPRKNQLLKYFSGGERQQIAILIAKLRNPNVLLLDEPFASLDPKRVDVCMRLIESISSKGCTILQISHDMNIAYSYGHRTVELNKGRISYDQTGVDRKIIK